MKINMKLCVLCGTRVCGEKPGDAVMLLRDGTDMETWAKVTERRPSCPRWAGGVCLAGVDARAIVSWETQGYVYLNPWWEAAKE